MNKALLDTMEMVKAGVVRIAEEGATDFEPVLFVATMDADGEGVMNIVPLKFLPNYNDGDARHSAFATLGMLMGREFADVSLEAVVHVSEAWQTTIAPTGIERKEVVIIHGMTGDGDEVAFWQSEFTRDEEKVALVGEWEEMGDGSESPLLQKFLLGYYRTEGDLN